MPSFSKQHLSASVNGRPVGISTTSSPGTAIHTAVTGSNAIDEVWLYARSNLASPTQLTIEWGNTTPDDRITVDVPFSGSGLQLVVPGLTISSGSIIRAFGLSSGSIFISGYVNRIA